MNRRKKPLILVVDDNPRNLQLLGNILDGDTYDVAMAMNGQEALDYLADEHPDLILLDVMMPGIDGFEVCKVFKREPKNRNVPILFLTAKVDPDDVVHGFECGGVDYITKPFNKAELMARINTHLELKWAREEILDLKCLLPICANCKKIRDDDGFWQKVESYLMAHTHAEFTHSICPDCRDGVLAEIKAFQDEKKKGRLTE